MSSREDEFRSIFCWQHCDKNKNIFCFKLPKCCPVCLVDLEGVSLRIPPFKIPYPFVDARDHPCSVVIKSSKGTFLESFVNEEDLHVGATDGRGDVYEFSERGVSRGGLGDDWNQCFRVNFSGSRLPDPVADDPDWPEYWNYTLERTVARGWSPDSYDPVHNNCFTFVLEFLKLLNQVPYSNYSKNKVMFCDKLILSKTTFIGKYISLYRNLKHNEVVVIQK